MRANAMALASMLCLLGCDALVVVDEGEDSRSSSYWWAEEVADYRSIELRCRGQESLAGQRAGQVTATKVNKSTLRLEGAFHVVRVADPSQGQSIAVSFRNGLNPYEVFMAAWVRPAGSSAPWRRIEVSRVYTADEDPPRTFSVRFRYFNTFTLSTQPPDSPERPAACFSGLAAGDAPELGFVEESIRTAEPMCNDHPLVKLETEVPTGPLELGFFAVPVMTWVPMDGLAGTYSYEISATCAGGCAVEPAGTCSLPASL